MPEAFWLNLSTEGCFFLLPAYFSPFLAFLICSSVLHPTHPPPLYLTSCISLSLHQGVEAQSDTSAQWAQVPDTRLHRVSEAEVWLLWPHVADPGPQAERDAERKRERGRGRKGGREREVKCLLSYKKANPNTKPEKRTFSSSPLSF